MLAKLTLAKIFVIKSTLKAFKIFNMCFFLFIYNQTGTKTVFFKFKNATFK